MEKKMLLETKKLTKYFGGLAAVNSLDLQIYQREITSFQGDAAKTYSTGSGSKGEDLIPGSMGANVAVRRESR